MAAADARGNAGFGLMGFLGQLGVRADLRYFGVTGDERASMEACCARDPASSWTIRNSGSM